MREPSPVVQTLMAEEGFRGGPYRDTNNKWAVGYGTQLPLLHDEAVLLLEHRLDKMTRHLEQVKPIVSRLDSSRQQALYAMCYQLGVRGLLDFNHMWAAIEKGDWQQAAREALNSDWARQTPGRAKRTAQKLLGEKDHARPTQ